MILISHRGNVENKNLELENNPDYIIKALSKGYNCEVDVWYINKQFFLCHDYNLDTRHKVDSNFLKNRYLWCHAKNTEAMFELQKLKCIFFWHQSDDLTLTSNGYLWTYPDKKLTKNSICLLPELSENIDFDCAGICSDQIAKYRNL